MSYVIQVVLSNARHPEYGQFTIPFPIPQDAYDDMVEALKNMEIGDPILQDCHVDELESSYSILKRLEKTNLNLDELDYQDIVDYIQFEQETAEIWPWLISGDEILAHETPLREIAGRLAAAGEWDTESIYDGLTEAFGNNPSLNNPSEFSPMKEGDQ